MYHVCFPSVDDGHSDCIYFLTYIVNDPVNMGGQIPLPQTYFLYFEPILLSHLENENLSFSIIHMDKYQF